jgi:plasmid stabilization system protein ParE
MRVRLTPEAEADVAQAFAWYSARSHELGTEFFASFEAVVHQIERFPEIGSAVHALLRRALLGRFPYCVFYSLAAQEVVIIGCFHAHRSPDAWRLRAGV